MILAQKQTYRSMKQNREPRNKPSHLQLIFDKGGKNIQWEKESLQQVVLGELIFKTLLNFQFVPSGF